MRPELPDYGCFPRWPAEGTAWIHPDDRAIVMRFLPSNRVLRRERFDGVFYHYCYGTTRFRLKPCMWFPLPNEGVDLGDMVETVGFGLERELFIATVVEAFYDPERNGIAYQLAKAGVTQEHHYACDEFKVLSDKSKLRPGNVEHPAPQWIDKHEDADAPRLHLGPDVEASDSTDDQ